MWFYTEKLLTNSSGNVEIRFFVIFTLGTEDIDTGSYGNSRSALNSKVLEEA